MKTIACVGCGGSVAIPDTFHGRRGECPLCGARFAVPEGAGGPESGGELPRSRGPWPFALPALTWPLGGPRARRCVACHRNQFALPGPCAFCDGQTVGLDAAGVADGHDLATVEAHREFLQAERLLNRATAAIWGVAAMIVALLLFETMRNRWWLANLFFFAIFAAPVVAGAGWLHAKAVGLAASWFAARHPEGPEVVDPDSPHASRVARLREAIVEPFLDRHGIAENTPTWAPEEERELLRQLLAREGLPMDADRLRAFLTACAFRRDFNRFRGRLAGAEADAPIAAYAEVAPEEASDVVAFPYLQQVLAESGGDADGGRVAALLRDVRRNRKLRSFEADLRDRKPAAPSLPARVDPPTGAVVAIEQVERMDPGHFERLAGMIYQSRGYFAREVPKVGENGADVLLEKGGERTVVRAKLHAHEVGDAAVREAQAAKAFYHCQHAILLTTHHFPPSAVELAARGGITLVDREGLVTLLDAFNRAPKDDARLALLLQPGPTASGRP